MTAPDHLVDRLLRDVAALRQALGGGVTSPQHRAAARPFLVVLTGLPGTGKSHFARELGSRVPFVLVDQPSYTMSESARLFAACHRLIEEYLEAGRRVVFDATNLKETHRQPLYPIAQRAGSPLVLVRFTASEEIVRRRLAERTARRAPAETSEADWLVYCRMLLTEEPIAGQHLTVDSGRDTSAALEHIIRLVNANG